MARHISSKLAWLSLLAMAGCSQILGLSDYEIDPSLGSAEGGDGNRGGEPGRGGSKSDAGEPGQADAGEPGQGQAGMPGQGGAPTTGGMPGQAGEPGQGGEPGAGGQPPGVLVPCDSQECCDDANGTAVGVEMLKDPGFELGLVEDGLSPWTESSTNDYPLITDGVAESASPHAGTYFAFLAGLTDETSDLESERLKIPADAGWLVLSGFRWFELDSLDADNYDFMGIGFYDYAVSDPLELPFFWDTSGDPGETTKWTRFEASWDAAPHAGQDRYLLLRGSTDDYADVDTFPASNYMLDDVSLKVFRCYE